MKVREDFILANICLKYRYCIIDKIIIINVLIKYRQMCCLKLSRQSLVVLYVVLNLFGEHF